MKEPFNPEAVSYDSSVFEDINKIYYELNENCEIV
jgi:hypothetical protein